MEYMFGDAEWAQGLGIASPEVQEAILDVEGLYGPQYVAQELGRAETSMFGTEDQAGLFDLTARAAPIVEGMRADIASSQRASDIADVEELGGRATEAFRASDPEMRALLDARRDLTMGLFDRAYGVTPQQERMAQQGAREAFQDRGREMGNAAIFSEALGREELLRQNRAEALNAAQGLFGNYQATAADPFMSVLGRPASALGFNQAQAAQALGMSGTTGPGLFNPDTGVNLAQQNYANQMNRDAAIYGADAARSGAIGGGFFSALGSILGGR